MLNPPIEMYVIPAGQTIHFLFSRDFAKQKLIIETNVEIRKREYMPHQAWTVGKLSSSDVQSYQPLIKEE